MTHSMGALESRLEQALARAAQLEAVNRSDKSEVSALQAETFDLKESLAQVNTAYASPTKSS